MSSLSRYSSGFIKGQKLYIGTSNGILLIYELSEDMSSTTLLYSKKSFSKFSIEQLEVIAELSLLICLSGGYVSIYEVESLALQNVLVSGGASRFAVYRQVEMINEIPTLITKVAIGARKKLLFYAWKDTQFIDVKDLVIPDKLLAVVWCNSRCLALGFPKEYLIVDAVTGHVTELFPVSKGKPLLTKIGFEEQLLIGKESNSSLMKQTLAFMWDLMEVLAEDQEFNGATFQNKLRFVLLLYWLCYQK